MVIGLLLELRTHRDSVHNDPSHPAPETRKGTGAPPLRPLSDRVSSSWSDGDEHRHELRCLAVSSIQLAVMQIAYGVMVDVLPPVRVTVTSQPDPSATGASMST